MSTLYGSNHRSFDVTKRFVCAVCALTAVQKVARVELLVFADDAALTFAIGDVLSGLWPAELEPAPRHEVVLAKGPASSGRLALTAFDIEGRVLHRQAA